MTYIITTNPTTLKQEIRYYVNGVLDSVEFYNSSVIIRSGYTNANAINENKLGLND